jgi:hypothetical protein
VKDTGCLWKWGEMKTETRTAGYARIFIIPRMISAEKQPTPETIISGNFTQEKELQGKKTSAATTETLGQ